MKKFKKIVIISVLLGFISSSTIASDIVTDINDCGRFGSMGFSDEGSFKVVNEHRGTGGSRFTDFLSIDEQLRIIKTGDLNTALLNLKKFCCENKIGNLTADTCKKDQPYFNDNALDSQYLFDHLFDVIMRRLNGLGSDIDIYTKTNMSLDDKGKERRNDISKIAEDTEGSSPQTIINKYQEVWKQSPSDLGYNITTKIYSTFGNLDNQKFLIYVSGKGGSGDTTIESKNIANALKNYDQRTLYDRYINACALSEYFYALLDRSNSSDKEKIIRKISQKACDKIVEEQIDGEDEYVRLVTKKSSNLFLSNYIEGYISYLYGRQENLLKLRTDVKDRRMDVVRGVPNLENRSIK